MPFRAAVCERRVRHCTANRPFFYGKVLEVKARGVNSVGAWFIHIPYYYCIVRILLQHNNVPHATKIEMVMKKNKDVKIFERPKYRVTIISC